MSAEKKLIRKSPRATFHNYSNGDYYVTICTKNKNYYFGEIKEGEMCLSIIGEYSKLQLDKITTHYPYTTIPLYVIMPNHIHAIICIDSDMELRTLEPSVPTRSLLSRLVGGFKRSITLFAKENNLEFNWQSRYYDHIIRGVKDKNIIAEYIEDNIKRWELNIHNK